MCRWRKNRVMGKRETGRHRPGRPYCLKRIKLVILCYIFLLSKKSHSTKAVSFAWEDRARHRFFSATGFHYFLFKNYLKKKQKNRCTSWHVRLEQLFSSLTICLLFFQSEFKIMASDRHRLALSVQRSKNIQFSNVRQVKAVSPQFWEGGTL